MIKKEARFIGIDDSPFNKFRDSEILVVGVVMRGGSAIDGILSTKVAVDGDDSTKRIAEMIIRSKFQTQLQCVFLNGIAVGGFNVIDVRELHEKTGLPVIIAIRKQPDIVKIRETLVRLNKKEKISLIEKAGEITKINGIFVQLMGINAVHAREILNIACTRSKIPEPIRLAHLIASGIILGESKGKA